MRAETRTPSRRSGCPRELDPRGSATSAPRDLEVVDERFAGRPAHAAAVHLKLGKILFERGDPRAVEVLRPALAVLETESLETDELFATVQNNLGAALLLHERYAEAEPFLRRAWEFREARFGPDHPFALTSQNNLAVLLQMTGRPAEAEPLLAAILDAWERLETPANPNAITAVYNYADVLRVLGRYEEAEGFFLEALARGRESLPEGHWLRALHRSRYGELLLETDRLEEARPLLVESHAELARSLGPEHARTARVAAALERLAAREREARDPD